MRLLLLASIFTIGSTAACLDSTGDQEQEITDGDTEDEIDPSDGDIACPAIAVECDDGLVPRDLDGDGCALECGEPVACPEIAVECPDGQAPIDADGDGCALECSTPIACPEIAVVCEEPLVPMDLDGDGCALECGVACGGPGEH